MKSLILRLKKGDEAVSKVIDFCQKNNIDSAWFSGLGATSQVELAIYDLEHKAYNRKSFSGVYEISSLTGNYGKIDSKPVVHCHGVFTDTNFEAIGGHVDKLIVAATLEVIINPLNVKLTRKHDKEIGLNLLEL